jgi:hypothetical protein
MFKSSKSKSGKICGIGLVFTLAFAMFISVLSVSCETEAEEESVVTATFSLKSGGVIYGGWTPIKISFNSPMCEADAAYLADVVKVRDHNYLPTAGTVSWEDNAIYFHPEKKWTTGEKYTCSVNGSFFASDGRVIVIKTELVFYAVSDRDVEKEPPGIPEIEEILFLRKTGNDDYEESPYDANEYWNNVVEGECGLKIRFNEEMDLSEIAEKFSMKPPRDYAVKVIDNRTLDVYFESDPDPAKQIAFTVSADIHSLLGEKLKRDYVFTFTEWKSDFQFLELSVLQNGEDCKETGEIPADWFGDGLLVGAESEKSGAPNRIIDFAFCFDGPLDMIAVMDFLAKITLIPDDERIERTPALLEVGAYAPDHYQTWEGMEYGSLGEKPYRYLIFIPGGIDGVHNGYGHYLEGDITVMLDVVDWAEIKSRL